jgi:hypothetical protein
MQIDDKLIDKYKQAIEMRHELREEIERMIDLGYPRNAMETAAFESARERYSKAWDEKARSGSAILNEIEQQIGIAEMHHRAEGGK